MPWPCSPPRGGGGCFRARCQGPAEKPQLPPSRAGSSLSATPKPPPLFNADCTSLTPSLSLPSLLVDHEQQLTLGSRFQDAVSMRKDAEPSAQSSPSLAFVTSLSLVPSCGPGAACPSSLAVFYPFALFMLIYLFLPPRRSPCCPGERGTPSSTRGSCVWGWQPSPWGSTGLVATSRQPPALLPPCAPLPPGSEDRLRLHRVLGWARGHGSGQLWHPCARPARATRGQ